MHSVCIQCVLHSTHAPDEGLKTALKTPMRNGQKPRLMGFLLPARMGEARPGTWEGLLILRRIRASRPWLGWRLNKMALEGVDHHVSHSPGMLRWLEPQRSSCDLLGKPKQGGHLSENCCFKGCQGQGTDGARHEEAMLDPAALNHFCHCGNQGQFPPSSFSALLQTLPYSGRSQAQGTRDSLGPRSFKWASKGH